MSSNRASTSVAPAAVDANNPLVSLYYRGQAPSIWVTFTQLAAQEKAVNLGQGFPDFAPPRDVVQSLIKTVQDPNYMVHQYTRGFGHARLVAVLAKIYSEQMRREVDASSEIIVSNGAYGSLFCAVHALVNPGDEVIIIEPFFDCYEPLVKSAGGTPVFVPLRPPAPRADGAAPSSADFHLDWDELEAAFSPKTRLLMVNSPNNPLGKVFTEQELQRLAEVCVRRDVLVVSDEVYEWIVYPPYAPQSLPRLARQAGMWERTLTIGSAGKTLSATGWKLGWAIGAERTIRALQCIHQNMLYNCNTPLQEAAARCLELQVARWSADDCMMRSLSHELLPVRDDLMRELTAMGMRPILPEGGYFMILDMSQLNLPAEIEDGSDDAMDFKLVRWLTKNKKLATIPTSAFYCKEHRHLGENYLRLCFIKKPETIASGLKILQDWMPEIK